MTIFVVADGVGGQRVLAIGGLVLCLVVAAVATAQKEALATDGIRVLLELAPVDPRSLMQGDYMDLEYAVSRDATNDESGHDTTDEWPRHGHLVLRLDDHGVGHYVRRHQGGTTLGPGEQLLRYRKKGWGRLDLGARSFFFQEGDAELYDAARYGELRVTESGDALLIGLLGERRDPLGRAGGAPLR